MSEIFVLILTPPTFQAVEVEFSEEEATDYVHRDKNKEINVLEWIALVIQEPLQVKLTSHFYSYI